MRIAIFTDDYLPNYSGVVASIQNYRRALESLGHEVFIIAPKFTDYIDDESHIIRVPSLPSPGNFKIAAGRRGLMLSPGLARKFDKYHFDIVHTQTEFLAGFLAHQVAQRQKIPIVSTLHTLYAEFIYDYPIDILVATVADNLATSVFLRKIPVNLLQTDLISSDRKTRLDCVKNKNWEVTKLFLENSNFVITPSEHLREKLCARGLDTPSTVLPNGIDTKFYRKDHATVPAFTKKPGEFYVVTVGRISGEKRQEILIDALTKLPQNIHAIIVGDGPDLDSLRQKATTLDLDDRVIFTGAKTHAEISDILRTTDAFAMLSYKFDNQPMVILEAIAAGLPMIYCDPDLREGLISDEKSVARNAILTDGIDGDAFAKAIQTLVDKPQLRDQLAAASLKLSQKFDSKYLAKRLIKIYENAINDYKKAADDDNKTTLRKILPRLPRRLMK